MRNMSSTGGTLESNLSPSTGKPGVTEQRANTLYQGQKQMNTNVDNSQTQPNLSINVTKTSAVPKHMMTSAQIPPSSPVVSMNKASLDPKKNFCATNTNGNTSKRRPSERRKAEKRRVSGITGIAGFPTPEQFLNMEEMKGNFQEDNGMKRNKTIPKEEDVEKLAEKFGSRRHSITNGSNGSGIGVGLDASMTQPDVAAHDNVARMVQFAAGTNNASAPAVRGRPSQGRKTNRPGSGGWTPQEDSVLRAMVDKHGLVWKTIAEALPGRTPSQCTQRWNKVLKPGLRKGTWTTEEDARLIQLVEEMPKKNWGDIASMIKGRSAKQCRERWCYNLDPAINKNAWSPEEDQILIEAQSERGNRWAHIASLLPGRTENAVKTRFKSIMRAKKREWHPSEDEIILKMHQQYGSRWDAIAEKLPKRTKNAVKTRYRLLAKGLASQPPPEGAPNQTLRKAFQLEHQQQKRMMMQQPPNQFGNTMSANTMPKKPQVQAPGMLGFTKSNAPPTRGFGTATQQQQYAQFQRQKLGGGQMHGYEQTVSDLLDHPIDNDVLGSVTGVDPSFMPFQLGQPNGGFSILQTGMNKATGLPNPPEGRRSSLQSAATGFSQMAVDDILGDQRRSSLNMMRFIPDPGQRRLSAMSQMSGDFRRGSAMLNGMDDSLMPAEPPQDEDLIDFLDAWNQNAVSSMDTEIAR